MAPASSHSPQSFHPPSSHTYRSLASAAAHTAGKGDGQGTIRALQVLAPGPSPRTWGHVEPGVSGMNVLTKRGVGRASVRAGIACSSGVRRRGVAGTLLDERPCALRVGSVEGRARGIGAARDSSPDGRPTDATLRRRHPNAGFERTPSAGEGPGARTWRARIFPWPSPLPAVWAAADARDLVYEACGASATTRAPWSHPLLIAHGRRDARLEKSLQLGTARPRRSGSCAATLPWGGPDCAPSACWPPRSLRTLYVRGSPR